VRKPFLKKGQGNIAKSCFNLEKNSISSVNKLSSSVSNAFLESDFKENDASPTELIKYKSMDKNISGF
jgi:hypothetical protein